MRCLTLTNAAMAIVTACFILVLGNRVEARAPSESSAPTIVTGEVAQVEGGFHRTKDPLGVDTLDIVDKVYVITDQAGREVRLELSDDTEILSRVIPGDKIEAEISSEGHTLSVTRLEP
ncbi:MAG TPA: hypothetical protein VK901_22500 [Nitrospiraceae bacterium]|nr:hypothetical protein [Nitrospiraceae bacterium]